MVFLKNALICSKKVKLINHDCLPILILLYIMLAKLMLFAALSNAVCLCDAFSFIIVIILLEFCVFANNFFILT